MAEIFNLLSIGKNKERRKRVIEVSTHSIKKLKSCRHIRERGGGATHCPQLKYIFFLKEKNMQIVLKRKNMHATNRFILLTPSLSYRLC